MIDFEPIFKRLPAFFERRPTKVTFGVSFDAYAELPALNASILKRRTALDMLYEMRCPEDREEKDCFTLGENLHTAVLEPHIWNQRVVILPEDAPSRPTARQINAKNPAKATLEAIAWWDEFNETNKGKTILSAEDHDQVVQMRDALHRHHEIKRLLTAPGNNEATVEVWNEEFQVMQKARFDRLPGKCVDANGNAVPSFVVDVKSTSANIDSDWAIRNEILKFGYGLQARYYLDILAAALDEPVRDRFYLAFVTNKEPYKARLYELNEHTPGDNLLNDARGILYQSGEHTVGRVPMFTGAALEFIRRCVEGHNDPLGAFPAYEHEGARLVEMASNRS